MSVRTILREPLLHFLLIGLALFLLYGGTSPGDSDSRRIVVSQSQVDDMVRQFQSTWNRSPSDAELSGLVDTYVREEILYREGRQLGLDKDDAVIKRRVRQKYELITEGGGRSTPTDADLMAYLKANPSAFVRPAIVTFEQIYFDPAITTPGQVAAAKSAITNGANPTTVGQASMLPRYTVKGSLDLVARDFGDKFAEQVGTVPVGRWVGPIPSGVGVHLVQVSERGASQLPPLELVRQAVEREWESDQRTRSRDADYRKVRTEYDVIIQARLPAAPRPR